MNTDTKILNKILTNWIWQHIKKIIHYVPFSFIPGIAGMVQHVQISKCNVAYNRFKDKKHMIFSTDTEKVSDKIYPFMMKTPKKQCSLT
jgi:hypothetical protein